MVLGLSPGEELHFMVLPMLKTQRGSCNLVIKLLDTLWVMRNSEEVGRGHITVTINWHFKIKNCGYVGAMGTQGFQQS